MCLSNAFLAFGAEVTASETGAGPPNKILGVKRDPFLILGGGEGRAVKRKGIEERSEETRRETEERRKGN